MKTEVKVEKSTASAVGNRNLFRRGDGNQIKASTKFDGETV